MEISKLIRHARDEEERLRRLGVDAQTLKQMARHSELMESIKGLNNYQNFPIENLRAMIFGPEMLSTVTNATEALFKSSMFSSVQEANFSALKLIEGLTSHRFALEQMTKLAGAMAGDWMNFKELNAPQAPVDRFLSSHLSQIIQTSALAQATLAGIELSKIGGAFRVSDEIKATLTNGFTDFSTSYKNLFKSFEVPETSLFTLPPSISKLPAIEFFNGVDLLETTVEKENEDEYEEERTFIRDEIRESANDSVIIQLRQVNNDWKTMLEGATQAFTSTNPDKTRHCITSLRELVREIMYYLSPDNQIKDWSTSLEDFANKRPTRKARLRYITRNINHGAFTEFVEKDIEAMLAAIDIFQAGTHVADSKLTDAQVAALIARVESAILFLFSIANYDE